MNAGRTRRLALATLLVCLGASGEAQVQFIEFTGRVVDAGSGQGIENLEIKLTPPKGVNLPIRLSEFGTVYRWEQSGELSGMTRVRCFTVDDAHLFCREDQVGEEVRGCLRLVKIAFETLGLTDFRSGCPADQTQHALPGAVPRRPARHSTRITRPPASGHAP